jgi:hypothetical protein
MIRLSIFGNQTPAEHIVQAPDIAAPVAAFRPTAQTFRQTVGITAA